MTRRTLGTANDFVYKLTRCKPIEGLLELLWNSLDADATKISINYSVDAIQSLVDITISDNGIGMSLKRAEEEFNKLGGSHKKFELKSPTGRDYHGSEGKGRYKALSIGTLIDFYSTYYDETLNKYYKFKITLDSNDLNGFDIDDEPQKVQGTNIITGVKIVIHNIIPKTKFLKSEEDKEQIIADLASYSLKYPNFKIFINERELDLKANIKNQKEKDFIVDTRNGAQEFKVRILEWQINRDKSVHKQIYYCNGSGITFDKKSSIGVRTPYPISVYILSDYIEELHKTNDLNVEFELGLQDEIKEITRKAQEFAKEYIRNRKLEYSQDFINDLKRNKEYPFDSEPTNPVDKAKRQVFDILAVEIKENIPKLLNENTKITLHLVKEALEETPTKRKKILKEVIELPDEKIEDLCELLEKTTLSSMIDTMNEVSNRLTILEGLETILFDKDIKKILLERQNLHKIIENETWIFGDDYHLGHSDNSLLNILKEHISSFERNNLVEIENNNKVYKDFFDYISANEYKVLDSLTKKETNKKLSFFKELLAFVNNQHTQNFAKYFKIIFENTEFVNKLLFIYRCSVNSLPNFIINNIKNKDGESILDTLKMAKKDEDKEAYDAIKKLFGAESYVTVAEQVENYIENHECLEKVAQILYENNVERLKSLIPDMCLGKQIPQGKAGCFENLVIELKRPSVVAGAKEIEQIEKYAYAVATDTRFDKSKNHWTFMLLVNDFNDYAEEKAQQEGRIYGHIQQGKYFDIHIKKWSTVINEAKARLQYLKDKLDLKMISNNEGLNLLQKKYAEYLPSDIMLYNKS